MGRTRRAEPARDPRWRCPACRRFVTEPMHRACRECREADEDRDVRAAEDAIEAGQARWSETGTSRRF